MRIGVFGGSFDPPHRGHLAVAEAASDRCQLDSVLLMPTAKQPLKPNGPLASFEDRLAMTALLCGIAPAGKLQASGLDGPRPDGGPNYTADLLAHLRTGLTPADEIFVIAGADAFLDIHHWRSPERLLELAQWIVVSRPGVQPEQLQQLRLTPAQQARVHWLGGVQEPVSATDVRARLAAGEDCSELVPAPVLAYIREHGLYRQR